MTDKEKKWTGRGIFGTREYARTFLIFFLYLFLTVLFTFPLILNLNDSFVDPGDPVLNAYILSWDTHALLTDPLNLFNANFFYPAKLTLTFSEHMLSNVLFFGPVNVVTKNPAFSLNITILITLFLTAVFTFIFVRYITGNSYAAFISGLIFAFGPPRLAQISHFQLIAMEWMPLSLYFFERYLSDRKMKYIVLFSAAFLLQLLSSYYLAYGFIVIALIYIVGRLIISRQSLNLIVLRNICISLFIAGLIFAAVTYPYIMAKNEYGLKKPIEESINNAANIFSYFSIYQRINIFSGYSFFNAKIQAHEKILFPGFICLFLSVIALKMKNPFKLPLLYGGLAAFILSLGPYLQVNNILTKIPLPYLVLYKLIPGFSSMRTPSRFGLMVFFVLSILSGLTIKSINEKIANRVKFLILFVILIGSILAEYISYPYPIAKFRFSQDELDTYKWIKKYSDGPVIEFPIARDFTKEEESNASTRYMLGSTFHWKPIVNGYSGFLPPIYFDIVHRIKRVPDEEGIEFLRDIGVNTVVLHGDRIDQPLPEYSSLNSHNIAKEVTFGNVKILQMKEMSIINNKKIKIKIPGKLIAGSRVTLEGEIEGPFRAIDFRPKVYIKFVSQKSGKSKKIKSRINLPLFIPEGKRDKFGITLKEMPKVIGEYKIEFLDKRENYTFDLERDSINVVDHLPSSNNSPEKLKAELYVDRKELYLTPGEEGMLVVRALNKGDAVWLASARKDHGQVKVGFTILDENLREITGGREELKYDIYPGEETDVTVYFKFPVTVGKYVLKLDMVSEHITWFEQQGSNPVFLDLIVK